MCFNSDKWDESSDCGYDYGYESEHEETTAVYITESDEYLGDIPSPCFSELIILSITSLSPVVHVNLACS